MSEKLKCDWMEIQDLPAHVCGLDPDEFTVEDVEEALQEKFFSMENGCLDAFHNIVERLLPLMEVGESPLTNKAYKGFVKLKNGHRMWVLKCEI